LHGWESPKRTGTHPLQGDMADGALPLTDRFENSRCIYLKKKENLPGINEGRF